MHTHPTQQQRNHLLIDPASFPLIALCSNLELIDRISLGSFFAGSSMKHPRDDDVCLSLSLTLGAAAGRKRLRRGTAGGGGEAGEFVCKTCSRAFASFQALGGHRTSHLRGRHGLALGLAAETRMKGPAKKQLEKPAAASHQCHICGLGFEMGQALGGHMRRHREEAAAEIPHAPPVLLELFV